MTVMAVRTHRKGGLLDVGKLGVDVGGAPDLLEHRTALVQVAALNERVGGLGQEDAT